MNGPAGRRGLRSLSSGRRVPQGPSCRTQARLQQAGRAARAARAVHFGAPRTPTAHPPAGLSGTGHIGSAAEEGSAAGRAASVAASGTSCAGVCGTAAAAAAAGVRRAAGVRAGGWPRFQGTWVSARTAAIIRRRRGHQQPEVTLASVDHPAGAAGGTRAVCARCSWRFALCPAPALSLTVQGPGRQQRQLRRQLTATAAAGWLQACSTPRCWRPKAAGASGTRC